MNPTDRAHQEALLSDNVYQRLKDYILSDVIKPPERLQIGQLSRHFGVSITPIREALIRLAAEHIVDARPGRGFFYKEFIPGEQIKSYEILFCLLKYALECRGNRPFQPQTEASEDAIPYGLHHNGSSLSAITAALAWERLYEKIALFRGNEQYVELTRNLCERTRVSRILAMEQYDDYSIAFEELHALASLLDAGENVQVLELLREQFEAKTARMHALARLRQHRIYDAYPLLRPGSPR